MSSAALSYTSSQPRRLSTKRRGSTASSASSLAADAAIRDFKDGRRRGSGDGGHGNESALAKGIDAFAEKVSATVQANGMPRWTIRALVLTGVGIVLAVAVVNTLPMLTRHEFAGTATLNGRPLASATLVFHQRGAPATSEPRSIHTAADGSFQVAAKGGLPPGFYEITVLPGASSKPIPEKYRSSETTPLRFEIREDLAGMQISVSDGKQPVRKNRR
jgi:hypothetical protein